MAAKVFIDLGKKSPEEVAELLNYHQVVEMTHDEKVAMYMKLTKKQLIEMLIECNRLLCPDIDTSISTAEITSSTVTNFDPDKDCYTDNFRTYYPKKKK